jgi:hypothetical protein
MIVNEYYPLLQPGELEHNAVLQLLDIVCLMSIILWRYDRRSLSDNFSKLRRQIASCISIGGRAIDGGNYQSEIDADSEAKANMKAENRIMINSRRLCAFWSASF